MNFESLARWRPRLEAAIAASYRRERGRRDLSAAPYVDVLSEFTLRGGKRFRALLVLAGYHVASGRAPGPALPAAVALEHFQSWMLIHDDVIDHAGERRGGPTVHVRLARESPASLAEPERGAFGVGMAITLGDLQEPLTVDALLRGRASPTVRLRVLEEYVRMTRETAYGQLLDIWNGARPPGEVREEDVLDVHRLKTAAYTVSAPLRIGAILGGARAPLLGELARIGTDLGVAFQLRDDVLGAGLGPVPPEKSPNDLAEGKRTLLVVKALELGDATDRAAVLAALGRADAPPATVDAAREAIRRSGSLEYSEQRIRALAGGAFRRIERSPKIPARARPLLKEIGEKLVQRTV